MTLIPEIQNGDKWKEQQVNFKLNGFEVSKIIREVIQKQKLDPYDTKYGTLAPITKLNI